MYISLQGGFNVGMTKPCLYIFDIGSIFNQKGSVCKTLALLSIIMEKIEELNNPPDYLALTVKVQKLNNYSGISLPAGNPVGRFSIHSVYS